MSIDALDLETLRNVALGIGLAAACGLRVFLPLLALSVASLFGGVELSGGLSWIGTYPALVVFAVATVAEVGAYHVPWLDNVLDWLAAPVAVVAGTLAVASALPEDDGLLRWVLAAIGGGGAAGTVHSVMALTRKVSSLTTGGLANPVLASAETGGSLVLSVLALVVPLVGLAAVIVVVVLLVRAWRRRRHRVRRDTLHDGPPSPLD